MIRGFRFPKRKRVVDDIRISEIRTRAQQEDEGLTGYVHGKPAESADEERFARSFDKYGLRFAYQVPIKTDYSMPEQDKQVDFIVDGIQPFEPRGRFPHHMSLAVEARDRIRELQLNEVFRQLGYRDLKYAEESEYAGGQDAVDEYVRREFR